MLNINDKTTQVISTTGTIASESSEKAEALMKIYITHLWVTWLSWHTHVSWYIYFKSVFTVEDLSYIPDMYIQIFLRSILLSRE